MPDVSIGFRAPSGVDLMAGWIGAALEAEAGRERFRDPGRRAQRHPGEIRAADLRALRALLRRSLSKDPGAFADWFGRFVTEPRREPAEEPPERPWTAPTLRKALAAGARLRRSAVARFAFVRGRGEGGPILFVGGEAHHLPRVLASAAELLTGSRPLNRETLSELITSRTGPALLASLASRGFLIVDLPAGGKMRRSRAERT